MNWKALALAFQKVATAYGTSAQNMVSGLNYMVQSMHVATTGLWRGVKVPGWERPELVGDGVTDNAALIKKLNFYAAYGIVKVPQPQTGGEVVKPVRVEVIALGNVGRLEMDLVEQKTTTDTLFGLVTARYHDLHLRAPHYEWVRAGFFGTGAGGAVLVKTVPAERLPAYQWQGIILEWHSSEGGLAEVVVRETPVSGVQVAGVGLPTDVPGRFVGDERDDTSGDVPDVPDYAWGWRLFRVQSYDEDQNVMVYGRKEPAFVIATSREGTLISWGKEYIWEEKRQTARCLYGREGKLLVTTGELHRDQAPDPRCECGFWATWHPQDLPLGGKGYQQDCIVAKVKAWGDIVEAPRGFRAPHMEIVEVALVNEEGAATLNDGDQASGLLEAVMKKYNVAPLSELIQENEPT